MAASAIDRTLVVGIGEILWDCLPAGPQLGGAPANFAWHCARLGLPAELVSAVGEDEPGREALRRLRAGGIPCAAVVGDPVYPTGKVDVELDSAGKPNYRFLSHTAWDHPRWDEAIATTLAQAACVCFGTLGQRSEDGRRFVRRSLSSAPPQALRIFDVNLRQNFYDRELLVEGMQNTDILKMNDEELPVLAEAAGMEFAGDAGSTVCEIQRRYNLQAVALTCGSDGAMLSTPAGMFRASAPKVAVTDTIGAGDAFTAVLAYGWLHKMTAADILHAAVHYAGLVCTFSGGMPMISGQMIQQHLGLIA